jgi:hypothetical protein
VPDEKEEEFNAQYYANDTDSDTDDEIKDVLDPLKRRAEGTRKSTRTKKQPSLLGYLVRTSHIQLSDDSNSDDDSDVEVINEDDL